MDPLLQFSSFSKAKKHTLNIELKIVARLVSVQSSLVTELSVTVVDTAALVVLLAVARPVLETEPDPADVVVGQAVVGEGSIGQAVEQLHAVRYIEDAQSGVTVEGQAQQVVAAVAA